MTSLRNNLFLITCLLIAGTSSAALEEQILPVPIYVEDTEVFSDLYIALKVEELGFPLVDRVPGEDPELDRMLDFFEAVVGRNWAAAEAQTMPLPPGSAVEANQEVFEAYADLLAGSISDIRIENQVALGDDRLLIWSVPSEAETAEYSRLYRSFRFMRREDAGALLYEGPRHDSLSVLVTNIYHEGQRLPDGLESVSGRNFEYAYDIPVENNGEPPRFLFDGSIVDTDVFGPPPTTLEPPALSFYRQAMAALKTGDPTVYAPFFAEESRERFENWVTNMEASAYVGYYEDIAFIGKRIYFVLNADPVYMLFNLPTNEGIEGASFRYDTVWRNPEGDWKVVNFYIEGFFDDIVKDRGLFEEPFLRPTLIAAGLLEEERIPLMIRKPVSSAPPPPQTANVLPTAPPVEPTPSPSSDGLPLWIWGLIVFLLILLAYFLRRQSASSPDSNSPSS
jgi:hypothetical protein